MKRMWEKMNKLAGVPRRFFRRHLNGSRGVISLFLAILMVPFLSIAGALINAGRINSAVAIFDEALCNASNSTLGTYDTFLKSRFGLLAMSQDIASERTGYTAQQLIEDTFQEYMRVNMGALSNTYFDPQISATGIYPLSDSDVLLTQINEYGKYTLPTKMVVSGLSLDSILNSLTSAAAPVAGLFNTMSGIANMADSCMTMDDKLVELKAAINTATAAETAKDTAYAAFSNAQAAYNTAVAERAEALAGNETKVSEGETKVREKQSALDTAAQAQQDLVNQLLELEGREAVTQAEKTAKEEEIKQFKDDHKDELKDYLDARKDLEDAEKELEGAEGKMASIEAEHTEILKAKRAALKNARDDYANALSSYTSALEGVGNGAIAVKDAHNSMTNSGVTLAQNFATNAVDICTESNKKNIDGLKKSYNETNDPQMQSELAQQIADAEENAQNAKEANKIPGQVSSSVREGTSAAQEFYDRDFEAIYASAYQTIINKKAAVKNYTVPDEDTRSANAVSGYQVTIPVGLTVGEVDALATEEGEAVIDYDFFGLCKALLSFIKALLTINIWYNWELISTVDGSYYADQSGLPSKRNRADSGYSLTSEFDQKDREQSENYKRLLDSYVDASSIALSANSMEDILETIKGHIDQLLECMENLGGLAFFRNLGNLIHTIVLLVGDFQNLFATFTGLDGIKTAIQQRLLLASYIGYNTPNRTTYTGSALTGAKYSDSLPLLGDESGMGFWGAETEYIIVGNQSEIVNQTTVFLEVYLVRFISDLLFVAINSEVAEIAQAATAATAVVGGWGGILVYVIYFLAEPVVDTILLVNNRTVPIVKTPLYLTPSGVPKLLEQIISIPIKEADDREKVQKELNKATQTIAPSTESVSLTENSISSTTTASSGGISAEKILDAFNVDYTKTLILLMAIFTSEKTLLRLGDVIQMEATCKAKDISPYQFNLDHSYTYLRASGQFNGHEFIKLSDTGILTSTNRVVYRGY